MSQKPSYGQNNISYKITAKDADSRTCVQPACSLEWHFYSNRSSALIPVQYATDHFPRHIVTAHRIVFSLHH